MVTLLALQESRQKREEQDGDEDNGSYFGDAICLTFVHTCVELSAASRYVRLAGT